MFAGEMPKGDIGDQHFAAEKLSPYLTIVQSLPVQLKRLFTHALQVIDLFFESSRTIFSNVSASREDEVDVQLAQFLERNDDLPDVVVRPQSSVLSADISVAGKKPTLVRFIQTNVVQAVPRSVDDVEVMLFCLDGPWYGGCRGRLRIAPHDYLIRIQMLLLSGYREDRNS